MAAPQDIKIESLGGIYIMDKTCSDEFDELFQLQGLNWIVRKALKSATITFTIQTYEDEAGLDHMIVQYSAGVGPSPPPEHRLLDWSVVPRKTLLGSLTGRTRFVPGTKNAFGFCNARFELQSSTGDGATNAAFTRFLRGEVSAEGKGMDGFIVEGDIEANQCVHQFTTNENVWTGEEMWGFENVNGSRRLTRRMAVFNCKTKKTKMARMVFAFSERR